MVEMVSVPRHAVHKLSLDAWSCIFEFLLLSDVSHLAQTCPAVNKIIKSTPKLTLAIEAYGSHIRAIRKRHTTSLLALASPTVASIRIALTSPCIGEGAGDCIRCELDNAYFGDGETRRILLGSPVRNGRRMPRLHPLTYASIREIVLCSRLHVGLKTARSLRLSMLNLQVLDVALSDARSFPILCLLSQLRTLRITCRIQRKRGNLLAKRERLHLVPLILPRSLGTIEIIGNGDSLLSLSSLARDDQEDVKWPANLTSLTFNSVCFSNDVRDKNDINLLLAHLPPLLERLVMSECESRLSVDWDHDIDHYLVLANAPLTLKYIRFVSSYTEFIYIDCANVSPSGLASIVFDTTCVDLITEYNGSQTIPLICNWVGPTSPFDSALLAHDNPLSVLDRSGDHPRIDDIRRAYEEAEKRGRGARVAFRGSVRNSRVLTIAATVTGIRAAICCSSYLVVDVVGLSSNRSSRRAIESLVDESSGKGADIEDWNKPLQEYFFAKPNQIVVISISCSASEFSLVVASSPCLKSARIAVRRQCAGIKFPMPLARRRAVLDELDIDFRSYGRFIRDVDAVNHKRPARRLWERNVAALEEKDLKYPDRLTYFSLSDAVEIIMDAIDSVHAVSLRIDTIGAILIKTLLKEVATRSTKHLNIRSFHGDLTDAQVNVLVEHFPPCVEAFVCDIQVLRGKGRQRRSHAHRHAKMPSTLKYLVCNVDGIVRF